MAFQQGADALHISFSHQWFEIDAGLVAAPDRKVAPSVVDVGDATTHPGGKVPTCFSEYDDGTVGHILAAVVAHTFHDSRRAGVADGKTFTCDAVEKDLARCCTVENDVADQDAFLGTSWADTR